MVKIKTMNIKARALAGRRREVVGARAGVERSGAMGRWRWVVGCGGGLRERARGFIPVSFASSHHVEV